MFDYFNSIFNFRIVGLYLPDFIAGITATLWISFVVLFFGLIIGTIVAILRASENGWAWRPAAFYIQSFRSTPLLVQIYVVYFALPAVPLLGRRLDEIEGGILALSLNAGAYLAEIIRAGISSVGRGQNEAAMAAGMGYLTRMRHIILPQAFSKVIPPILGHAAVIIKDSSLLSLITVFELMSAGLRVMSEFIKPTEGLVTAAAGYLLIYVLMLLISAYAQSQLNADRAAARRK